MLEGGEGGGKTGVVAHLVDQLRDKGFDVLATREPGGTPEGKTLRSILLQAGGPSWDPAAELLLMGADRVQHLRRVIEPALAAGMIVVCDRYVGSTLAYQGAGRGLAEKFIREMHAETTGDAWPDLTILLDIDPAIGLSRSRKRLDVGSIDEGRFEQLDLDFHRRVRDSFLAQAAQLDDRAIVIDASGSEDEVKRVASDELLPYLTRVNLSRSTP